VVKICGLHRGTFIVKTRMAVEVITSQTLMATQPKEHFMTTQTRRIASRSAKFFRATGKAYLVTACCALVLLSAVAPS